MNTEEIIHKHWKGVTVDFQRSDAFVRINEMCAKFNKVPNEFLRLPSTKELIEALAEDTGIPAEQLVISRRGGDTSNAGKSRNAQASFGTWLHPDLGIACAGWCSAKFMLWMVRTVRLLMAGAEVKRDYAAMSRPEKRRVMAAISAQYAEHKVAMHRLRMQKQQLKDSEEIAGHLTIREWLAGRALALPDKGVSMLASRLRRGALAGLWTEGAKTVPVNNLSRTQRQPTYPPEEIASAYTALFGKPCLTLESGEAPRQLGA